MTRSRTIWRVAALALAISVGPGTSVAGAATPKCLGKKATIVGKKAADNGKRRLKGTRRADVIVSRGGNDVVSGGGGDDRICGGAGNDVLDGGSGDDRIHGGSGRDRCTGGPGRNTLKACETDQAGANKPPVPGADSATTSEDAPVAIAVLANDSDPDRGALAITALNLTGLKGAASLSGPSVVFDPRGRFDGLAAGATATDTFTYTLSDGQGGVAAGTVTLTVTGVDDAPTAVADTAQIQIPPWSAAAIEVLANDTDVDGGPKRIESVNDFGSSGVVAVTGEGAGLTYTPNSGFCSATPATFSYTLNGGSTGIVSVTVACPAPGTAIDDEATVAEDGSVVIGVLANDTPPLQGDNTVESTTSPAHGAAQIVAGGIEYTPAPDYCNEPGPAAPDAFTYTLTNGKTATVTVTVTCVNDDPLAADDSFDSSELFAFGNTTLAVGTAVGEPSRALAGNVLTNDQDPEGDALTAGPALITGTWDGKLTMNPDGSFVYRPPPGLAGIVEYFNYTVSDGHGGTDVGEIGILLKDPMIWYVDSAAAPGGNGTSGAPLQTLEDLGGGADLDQPGDLIYVRQRDGHVYQGGAFLEANQKLIGSKRGLTVDGIQLAAPTAGQPVITNAFGNGVTLANGAHVLGVQVDQASQVGILGDAITNATIGSDVTVSNAGLDAFRLAGAASGTIDFGGAITGIVGMEHVDVRDRSGGQVTFSGPISGYGAIYLGNNSTAAITFSGGLNLDSQGRPAFGAESGGTVAVTGNGNVLSAQGRGLSLTATPIAAAGLTFQSISAQSTDSGIVLNDTGTAGGLTVTGTGAANSGGTIAIAIGPGISLTNTAKVSLNNMRIEAPDQAGVKGTQVTGFAFTNGAITSAGESATSADDAALAFNTAGANNLAGVVNIAGNTITNPYGSGIDIRNYAGTISDATISGNSISSTTSTDSSKGGGIRVRMLGTASTAGTLTKASIANNQVLNFPAAIGIEVLAQQNLGAGPFAGAGSVGNAINVVTIAGNQVRGDATTKMQDAILASTENRAASNVLIENNGTAPAPLRYVNGRGIGVHTSGPGVSSYVVNNNFLVAESAGGWPGISASAVGIVPGPGMAVRVSNNTVSASSGPGVSAENGDGFGALRVAIQGNTIGRPTGPSAGITVRNGFSDNPMFSPVMCTNISGNTTAGGTTPSGNLPGIEIFNRDNTAGAGGTDYTFQLNGLAPNSNSSSTENHLMSVNPASALGSGFWAGKSATVSDGTSFGGCSLP